MSAVAEEKFGSSSVHRNSVPAGTRMSCAFVLACTPRNNTENAKYAEIRRMCYLPVRRPGRTCSKRQCEDSDRRTSMISALPGPTRCLAPENFFAECNRKTTPATAAISIGKIYSVALKYHFITAKQALKPTNTRLPQKLRLSRSPAKNRAAPRRSRALRKFRQACKAPEPTLLVHLAEFLARNALVRHNHFGVVVALFKLHCDPLRTLRLRLDPPGVNQLARRFDHFEFPGDPQDFSVW